MGHHLCRGVVPNKQVVDNSRNNIRRTCSKAQYRVRCSELTSEDFEKGYPVKVVVFDLDETLTLVTLMNKNGCYGEEERAYVAKWNFESPWVEGSRIAKLKQMFENVVVGKNGKPRLLSVLTKNGNLGGVKAVLDLLNAADLGNYFNAIWTMPWRDGCSNGMYQESSGEWKFFDPPLTKVHNHKADILHNVAHEPTSWFPQLANMSSERSRDFLDMRPEGVVLVDDMRANFKSDSGVSLLRYVKVARYDAHYRNRGFLRDMGGIGAHCDEDYEYLKRFLDDPWMYQATLSVRCLERDYEGSDQQLPVKLVLFDFDETLTLTTFLPKREPNEENWSDADLVRYNFESTFLSGSRVQKLRTMLRELARRWTLAVLTRNEAGVNTVLTLLKMAHLDESFQAIWVMPWTPDSKIQKGPSLPDNTGAYKSGSQWKFFRAPFEQVYSHKADAIHHLVANPRVWFPQLAEASIASRRLQRLLNMRVENVVLVDDERANFRSEYGDEAKVLRYCKVARYDEKYRDCGVLNQMGGIGAHSDEDYANLKAFLQQPWDYPYESAPAESTGQFMVESNEEEVDDGLVRNLQIDDEHKTPRQRTKNLHVPVHELILHRFAKVCACLCSS